MYKLEELNAKKIADLQLIAQESNIKVRVNPKGAVPFPSFRCPHQQIRSKKDLSGSHSCGPVIFRLPKHYK